MAFDLYVGPVTRYVLGDWKTVGQQIAEAQGLSYKVVGPGARKPKNFWQRKSFEKDNARWRRALGSFLFENGVQEPLWDDSPQKDFLSDRPGWEGYTGLILRYAYLLRPDRLPPSRLPSFDKMNEDPVVEGGRGHVEVILRVGILLVLVTG